MVKLPKISVIILSWNRKKDTLETIESLAKSNVKDFILEINVIDNASTDDSVTAVKEIFKKIKKLPNILTRLTVNKTNLGFAGGNNVGMKDAIKWGFDYVALLNDDTMVNENLVVNILMEHEKYQDAGAISPKIYFAKGFEYHKKYKDSELGKVIWYAGGDIDWKNVYGSNRGVDEVDIGQFNQVIETDFATGCFVMYKSKVLKDIGYYDERYFAYMEDADYAQRIKKTGYKVLYSPNGVLWHKVSQSSGIGSDLNDYFLTRNRMIFGLSYAPLWTKQALIRESIRLLVNGRKWQKIGIKDFYLGRFGKGSWGKR